MDNNSQNNIGNTDVIAQPPAVANMVATPPSKITLDQLINLCIEKEGSDIHFREGGKLALRTGGHLVFIENIEKLSKQDAEQMIDMMISSSEKKQLEQDKEIDFSYTHTNGINFRVNIFYQKGRLAGVMRMISKNIPTMEEIGTPEIMKSFLNLKEGLILVCGPAGSGKSTTIQSMLNYVNQNFVQHILTIEDPIEYVFEDNKSIFTQREVGKDVLSTVQAIHSADRADANIVMVSEIRNFEILNQALSLVETGHLVIASMPTKDSLQTLERLINMCSPDLKKQTQERIANNLKCILTQDLLSRKDRVGLIPVFELMLLTQNIKNIIQHGNLIQLKAAMQSAANQGMFTMDSYAYRLVEQGIVEQAQIEPYISSEE